MHRRALALLTLFVVATVALGACGKNSGPSLSDPKEIITKSIAALQKAKTVHVEATVDGTLKADVTGTGASGGMTLAGTKLTADVDLAGTKLHAALAAPALLGMSADIIVIGTDTWTKVSLTGDKYQKSTTAAGSPADPASVIAEVKSFLDKPEVSPAKKDDASCGSKSCYTIEINLSAADLKTLVPGTDLGDATIVATILIARDTLYPASATVAVKGTMVGDLTLKVTFSDWDKTVTVTAPPADQVQ